MVGILGLENYDINIVKDEIDDEATEKISDPEISLVEAELDNTNDGIKDYVAEIQSQSSIVEATVENKQDVFMENQISIVEAVVEMNHKDDSVKNDITEPEISLIEVGVNKKPVEIKDNAVETERSIVEAAVESQSEGDDKVKDVTETGRSIVEAALDSGPEEISHQCSTSTKSCNSNEGQKSHRRYS